MGWATSYIKTLEETGVVAFRPKGKSMEPIIMDGQLVTVRTVNLEDIEIGDVVLCTVGRNDYLHLVKNLSWVPAEDGHGASQLTFQIGNNKGRINGWTTQIHGRVSGKAGEVPA